MSARGFTLVELMVVVAIMAILGTIGFINFRTSSNIQILNDGANKVQSFLRAAQANSTASLKCAGSGSTEWQVIFTNKITPIDLKCKTSSTSTPTLFQQLPLPANITIDLITGDGGPSCTVSFPTNPLQVSFNTLYGTISFGDPALSSTCLQSINNLTITVKYTQGETSLTKNIIVSKGGGIDVQK